MKTIGTAATLIGAVALMFAIIVAQQDYQRSWTADGVAQTSAQSETATTVPERLARANQ
jgi:FlaG/FlaF family flagellin (archaellin)